MAQLTIPQTFDLALRQHQAGRLPEAESLYQQILVHQPEHADALHMLGVIAYQTRRYDVAANLIRRAIGIMPNWPEAYYNLGNALKDGGQLDQAIAAFQQALALKPAWPEAYNNLGNALQANGQADEAIAACRQAIALQANYPQAYNNLGNALRDKGNVDQAITAFRQALAMAPGFPEAHNNLGTALKDKGNLDQAIAAYRQAIALHPSYAEAYSNLGVALKEQGQLDEAIAAYRHAIVLNPSHAEAYNNLGVALIDKGQPEQTIAAYRQALAINPNYAETHSNLGVALRDQGRLDDAIAACRQATVFKPNDGEAHNNLGMVLNDMGYLDEAVAACRQAIALKPNYAEAHNNLGLVLNDQGHLDEATAAYRQALALKPGLGDGHWNLALALLARGDFAQGWEEYEWRWRAKELRLSPPSFAQPQWDGSPLDGRTILLHAEQGFGDTLQFIRYLPLVIQRGGRVIVECQAELQRLLQTIAGDIPAVARGQPLPEFAVHCPLLSLPKLLGTTLATIPDNVPYLTASAPDVALWRSGLASHGSSVKVGLLWAGNPRHKNDRNRSMKLADMAPLAQVPGAEFYSLQKGAATAQAKTPPPGMELIDATDDLKDFADTAGLIANLDLVIAVDTAVAHLAGAMGKPVWTLLPFVPDWRWLRDREDTPWYPTMRLFRQQVAGHWDEVITRVSQALSLVVANHRRQFGTGAKI